MGNADFLLDPADIRAVCARRKSNRFRCREEEGALKVLESISAAAPRRSFLRNLGLDPLNLLLFWDALRSGIIKRLVNGGEWHVANRVSQYLQLVKIVTLSM